MLGLTWVRGLATRRTGRLIAMTAGIAVTVGLLASIGTFLASSKATMTRRAIATVAVDWQVEVQPGADPRAIVATTRSAPGVRAALPVGFAQTAGFTARTGATTQTTGPGMVLGLPPHYRATFPGEIRSLAGRRGVVLAQQTAANLHVAPGDMIEIGRTGLAPALVRVDGVVDLPQADTLFQKVGAPPGSQPQAPPDNVLLLPVRDWHALFDPLAAARPDLVRQQAHVQRSHRLPSDPSAAYSSVTAAARNLELRTAGGGLVGDNLGATLGAAREDALYAQVLFLFLALPGAVLAGLLTAVVAGSDRERRRRDLALLRTRGATPRVLAGLGVSEALLVGGIAAVAGLGTAAIVGELAFGTADFGATTATAAAWAGAAVLAGIVVAVLTIALPIWRDARTVNVVTARRTIGRVGTPRWARYGLDVILLALGAITFWLTSRNGYALVLAPEGTPSISVSYWALAGPALVWVGAGLLTWRIADAVLAHGRRAVAVVLRPLVGSIADPAAAAMARQRRLLATALTLLMLTFAFAASTAVFNVTYRQQAEVDARLTNGADVTVTEPPGARIGPNGGARLARIPGVAHVEPLQHRFAYVGADLQDLYGVRPSTIVAATSLQDAYFAGGSARDLMSRLAAHPDGVLVSAETVHDFRLAPHDRITLRLQDAHTNEYTDVPFHYLGVAREFPTAPSDSFLVANASYVAQRTGSDAVGTFLLDTGAASPATIARRVRDVTGTAATVTDIETSRRIVGSSLTSVDLSGLTRVELVFALGLAGAAAGLVLVLHAAARRRTFAIASALGARRRQIAAFVWSEAAFVMIGGLVLGALGGWMLAEMLVKVLTGVFDPPPSSLAVPWRYLGGLVLVTVAAIATAASATVRRATRPTISTLRDL